MSWGLGSTDVSKLAAAMAAHSINPSYVTKMWQPGYTDTPEALPSQLCLDDATSKQIAGLLGGSVVQMPAQNLNGQVPLCNFIQLPDGGLVRAADVAQIAGISPNIYGMSELCGYEQLLSMGIPGGVMGSDCGTNPVSGYDPNAGSASYVPPVPVKTMPPPTPPVSNTTPPAKVTLPPSHTAPGYAAPPADSQVVSGTPGANAGSDFSISSNDSLSFNFSAVPWWVWGGGAAVALYLMTKGGR